MGKKADQLTSKYLVSFATGLPKLPFPFVYKNVVELQTQRRVSESLDNFRDQIGDIIITCIESGRDNYRDLLPLEENFDPSVAISQLIDAEKRLAALRQMPQPQVGVQEMHSLLQLYLCAAGDPKYHAHVVGGGFGTKKQKELKRRIPHKKKLLKIFAIHELMHAVVPAYQYRLNHEVVRVAIKNLCINIFGASNLEHCRRLRLRGHALRNGETTVDQDFRHYLINCVSDIQQSLCVELDKTSENNELRGPLAVCLSVANNSLQAIKLSGRIEDYARRESAF
jgi:hypothetical protein